VGKDIIYFHGLFWPALLAGGGYRLPTNIFAHGFLTIQGQKMSKSRGTFITVKQYQQHLNPLYLRYYFAAKLNDSIEDIDLNWEDFATRVNSDLVGKWVNIASRCSHFIETYFDGKLSASLWDKGLYESCMLAGDTIAQAFDNREYSRAIRDIMHWADETNRFIDVHKPWAAIKNPEEREAVQAICTTGLNLFKLLALYLKPVLPSLIEEVEAFLDCDALDWSTDSLAPLLNQSICPFTPLLQRVDVSGVQTMLNEAAPAPTVSHFLPLATEIGMEDFSKIDLRVAKILNAEAIPEADKLIKLTVDIGEDTPRIIFSGIKAYFEPKDLIGKMTLVIANLAPRKMRFGVSEGMLLLAGGTTGDLFLLEPQSGAEPGMKVK
jgi:methionyl-tRNA synthetase